MTRDVLWWDKWFLGMAQYVSTASKDPSTKTGAVIVDKDKRIVSVGFNGFPKLIKDSDELLNNREQKYARIIHCEMNAILFSKSSLENCTLYTYPFLSCSRCAVHVIQSGITRVVAPSIPLELKDRWEKELELATNLFKEANIEIKIIGE